MGVCSNTGSDNGLVLSGNKPLLEPKLIIPADALNPGINRTSITFTQAKNDGRSKVEINCNQYFWVRYVIFWNMWNATAIAQVHCTITTRIRDHGCGHRHEWQEQLCLHSEDTPSRPMIVHTTDSFGSRVKIRQSQSYKFHPQIDGQIDIQTWWNQYTMFQLHWSRGYNDGPVYWCIYVSLSLSELTWPFWDITCSAQECACQLTHLSWVSHICISELGQPWFR